MLHAPLLRFQQIALRSRHVPGADVRIHLHHFTLGHGQTIDGGGIHDERGRIPSTLLPRVPDARESELHGLHLHPPPQSTI